MQADLMILYLSIASTIGTIFQERIDPMLTMTLFSVGLYAHLETTELFPSLVEVLVDCADHEYWLGLGQQDPSLPQLTPLQVWNHYEVPKPSAAAVCAALFPAFSTLVLILVYVSIRKAFQHFRPDLTKKWKLNSVRKRSSSLRAEERPRLTQFEIATGVELHPRYGVVTNHIKSMMFVSADGVHVNIFVIANGKFLVHTSNLFTILLIKLTSALQERVRVRRGRERREGNTPACVPGDYPYRDMLLLNLRILL
ncbi:hypothetical protein FI667_g14375, partial [Globisporangium splendens]